MKNFPLLLKLINDTEWKWTEPAFSENLKKLGWIGKQKLPQRVVYRIPKIGEAHVFAENGALKKIQVLLEVFLEPESLKYPENKAREFYNLFDQATEEANQVFGEPEFCGGGCNKGFPKTEEAIAVVVTDGERFPVV